jgi:hypothetical protein
MTQGVCLFVCMSLSDNSAHLPVNLPPSRLTVKNHENGHSPKGAALIHTATFRGGADFPFVCKLHLPLLGILRERKRETGDRATSK